MPKIYRRNCDHCGEYYVKSNAKFCSRACYYQSDSCRKSDKGKKTLEHKFWSKVKKGESDECWEWQGYTLPTGYGQLTNDDYSSNIASRISYFLAYGKFDESLFVCHKCDNPPCVNPNHLFLGTNRDNILDSIKKGRFPIGERNWKATLTDDQRKEIERLISLGKQNTEIGELLNIQPYFVSNIKQSKYRRLLNENLGD